LEVQFFNSFLKLPLTQKKLNLKINKTLPVGNKKILTFLPFNYDLLNLQKKLKDATLTTLNPSVLRLPVTSLQLSLLYILQP
jgi:hypothetical protein